MTSTVSISLVSVDCQPVAADSWKCGPVFPDFSMSQEKSQIWIFKIFKDFIYLFLEIREGREKERERNIDVREKQSVTSRRLPTRDPAHTPGMCSDRKRNQQPFSLQAGTPATERATPARAQILILMCDTMSLKLCFQV